MNDYLVIIEDGYRGSIESQFVDMLYFIREMNRQFDKIDSGVDVVLRGSAVTYAVPGPVPSIRVGDRKVDTLTDPHESLRRLIGEGAKVRVEEDDLRTLGLTKDDLLDNVELVSSNETALFWKDYRHVWFM